MNSSNTYIQNLSRSVISNSNSNTWEGAVREWNIVDCSIDSSCSSQCICGKESIKYLFTISNFITGRSLHPIGSRCIQKFGRSDLDMTVSLYEQMDKLRNAVSSGKYISFTSDFFSRRLLEYLYEEGAFTPNNWNNHNPRKDYQFLLDMFNKRTSPSEAQDRKIKALIVTAIKPFIESRLKYIS